MEATKKQCKEALALMNEHGKDKIFLNDKGNFFFSLRGAAISVDSDPDRLLVLEKKNLAVAEEANEETGSDEATDSDKKETVKKKAVVTKPDAAKTPASSGTKGTKPKATKAATTPVVPATPATPSGVATEGTKPDVAPVIPAITDGGTKSDETPAPAGDGSTSNAVA